MDPEELRKKLEMAELPVLKRHLGIFWHEHGAAFSRWWKEELTTADRRCIVREVSPSLPTNHVDPIKNSKLARESAAEKTADKENTLGAAATCTTEAPAKAKKRRAAVLLGTEQTLAPELTLNTALNDQGEALIDLASYYATTDPKESNLDDFDYVLQLKEAHIMPLPPVPFGSELFIDDDGVAYEINSNRMSKKEMDDVQGWIATGSLKDPNAIWARNQRQMIIFSFFSLLVDQYRATLQKAPQSWNVKILAERASSAASSAGRLPGESKNQYKKRMAALKKD